MILQILTRRNPSHNVAGWCVPSHLRIVIRDASVDEVSEVARHHSGLVSPFHAVMV